MYTQLRLRVWVVEPTDAGELDAETAMHADASVLDEATFRRRLEAGDRPDALLVDAQTLERLDGHRFALDGVVRMAIVTDGDGDGLPGAYLDRPSIRVLRRPVDAADRVRALQWLSGVEDDGWAAGASR
jgi:hypothetical protein